MFGRILTIRMWVVWLFSLLGLSIAFYLVLGLGAKSTITQQLLEREQTLARAEASSLADFFRVFGDSIAVLAQLHSLDRRDAVTIQDMDAFVDQWRSSDLVGGVVLTDSQGIVRFNSNVLGTRDIGRSLADRDYFLWAEGQSGEGKYFVGKAIVSRLGASKGQTIVVVASPVFNNGVFTGVVAASVRLKPLTERYLELMKVSDLADAYLIGADGDLLYNGPDTEVVDKSIFESQDPFSVDQNLTDRISSALARGQEDKLQIGYSDPKSGKRNEHLIVMAPVKLEDRNWLVILSSPIQATVDLVTPVYVRLAAIFVLVSLTTLLFGVIVARDSWKRFGSQPTERSK